MTEAGWVLPCRAGARTQSAFPASDIEAPSVQMLAARLAASPDGRVNADAVLEELGTLLPYDHPAKLLETLIAWGRYAELIDFDQNANVVYLHEASEGDDADEATTP